MVPVAHTPASPRFLAVLGVLLAAVVARSGVGCHYPEDWLLENVLVVAGVALMAATYRAAPLSRAAYVQILVFLALHEVGAHWTFAEVPYDHWWRGLFGVGLNEALGWERNHYDRLVHLSFGLLLARPLQEVLERWLSLRGFKAAFTAWMYVFASAAFYELVEWTAALIFGGELGMAYLGTQGDVWDSHKDTALAVGGAAAALVGWGLFARNEAP